MKHVQAYPPDEKLRKVFLEGIEWVKFREKVKKNILLEQKH